MLTVRGYSIIATVLLIAVSAYAVFITLRNIKNRKHEKTNKAIADTFVAIAYIDLATNTFEEISFKEKIRQILGSKGNAQEALYKTITPDLVIETYHNRMIEFTDLSTVEKRLKNKHIISEEYKSPTNGWSRSNFIPVEYDEEGNLKTVLYTVQWINGEVLSLHGKLDIEETLLECVLTLSKNTDADTSVNQLLANVANYHNADRAYIFEIDYKHGTASNTYEWCKIGIEPQIQVLQNLKMKDIQLFINLCKMEVLKLADINYFSKDSEEYRLLEQQGITSLMCIPLLKNGDMIGFIGVDNPRINRETVSIMKSVSSFVLTELEKKEYITELYELSYKDMMTGVYNRHANIRDVNELSGKKIEKLGIVYGDVNGLKETNDKFGHEHGDRLIMNAADMLKKYYNREDDAIYRVGGDEFIVICKNISEEAFNQNYENLVNELGPHHILSVGKSWLASCNNINEHVKVAERGMYETKQNYYKTHDRRGRA